MTSQIMSAYNACLMYVLCQVVIFKRFFYKHFDDQSN